MPFKALIESGIGRSLKNFADILTSGRYFSMLHHVLVDVALSVTYHTLNNTRSHLLFRKHRALNRQIADLCRPQFRVRLYRSHWHCSADDNSRRQRQQHHQ